MDVESPLGDSSTGFLIHLMPFYPVLSTRGKQTSNPPAPPRTSLKYSLCDLLGSEIGFEHTSVTLEEHINSVARVETQGHLEDNGLTRSVS